MGNGKSEIVENLELWNSGTLELWNFGTLELWNPEAERKAQSVKRKEMVFISLFSA